MNQESDSLREAARTLLDTFLTRVDGVRTKAEIEDIHQARTSSRRLQALLALALPSDDKVRRMCRVLRKYRRVLGDCRDADVTLGHLKRVAEGAPPGRCSALALLSDFVAGRREKALEAARSRLRRIDTPDERRSMRAALRDIQAPGEEPVPRIAALLKARSDRLAVTLLCASQSGDSIDLHAGRIAGKKLRYVAEFAPLFGIHPEESAVARLKSLQDDLGYWHDLLTLETWVLDFCNSRKRLSNAPLEIGELLVWLTELRTEMAHTASTCLAAHAPSESGTRITADAPAGAGGASLTAEQT